MAKELELTDTTVRRWVNQAAVDQGRRAGTTTGDTEELARRPMTVRCRAFVEAEKHAGGNVGNACDLLEVSRSAFYASIGRAPSARARTDAEL